MKRTLLLLALLVSCSKNPSTPQKNQKITLYNLDQTPIEISLSALRSLQKPRSYTSSLIKAGGLVFVVGAKQENSIPVFLDRGAKVVVFEKKNEHRLKIKNHFGADARVFIESVRLTGPSRLQFEAAPTLDRMMKKYGVPDLCIISKSYLKDGVLQGMSQPVEVVCLDYIEKELVQIKQALAYLTQLGYTKFNFSIEKKDYFLSPIWLRSDEIIDRIEALPHTHDFTSLGCLRGRLFARLH